MMICLATSIIMINALIYAFKNLFSKKKSNMIEVSTKEEHDLTQKQWKVFGISLLARAIFLLVGMIFVYYQYKPEKATFSFFMDELCKGDGVRFFQIASYGYTELFQDETEMFNICMFPLYPWLMRILGVVFGNIKFTGLLISNICFCFSMVLLYRIVTQDYDENIAFKSIALFTFSPFSFFFGLVMSESLFLLLTLTTWLLLKKKYWLGAGVCGMLSALTRNFGILMVIPYGITLLKQNRESIMKRDFKSVIKNFWKDGKWILLIPIGTLIYMGVNYYYFRDCFQFMKYQQTHWEHEFCYFGVGTKEMIAHAFDPTLKIGFRMIRHIPNAIYIIIFNILMVIGLKKHQSEYLFYALAYFLICVSDKWQMSLTRLLTALFPFHVFVAKEFEKGGVLYYSILIVSVLFLNVLYMLHLFEYPVW